MANSTSLALSLANTRIADGLTAEQVDLLAGIAQLKGYEDGSVILGESDKSHDLLVLLTGSADVRNVFDQEIGVVDAGSLIGELSFLDGKARSAKVVSRGQTECAVITRSAIQTLRTDHPEILAIIMHNIALGLAEKLRGATRLVTALSAGF